MDKALLDTLFIWSLGIVAAIVVFVGPLIYSSSRRIGGLNQPGAPVHDQRDEYERVFREASFLTHRPEEQVNSTATRERRY